VGIRLPQSCGNMEELKRELVRRTFRWPGAARELVRAYLRSAEAKDNGPGGRIALKTLITRVAAVSGNPRGACWRFVRQAGVKTKRSYRGWTKEEQQKLLSLMGSHSLRQVMLLMRRSPTSIRSMLHRLGASARMGQDWFTKHTLAEALHVRADEVEKWIDRGWLKHDSYNSQGRSEHSQGTLSGDTWTWKSSQTYGGQEIEQRMTIKTLSPTSYAMKFEISMDGTNWTTFMEVKATKSK
jgi:hypothetical protein